MDCVFSSPGGDAAGLGCTWAEGVCWEDRGGAFVLEGVVAGWVAELAMEDVEGYWRRAAPAAALLATLDEELPMAEIRL